MSVLRPEDIVAHSGNVEAALKEKREIAAQQLKETGSFPEWWEVDIHVGKGTKPRKYSSVDEYFSKGYDYFIRCHEEGKPPTRSGLLLWLGFTTFSGMINHVRRNPEFREAQGTLMLMLQKPLEEMLQTESGGQQGKKFILQNIPDGFDATDAANAPMKYEWKEKVQTELTGANGGPIEVSRKIDPEEGYLAMLEGGKLKAEGEDEEDSEGVTEE